jgi:hypothetical protein
MEFKQFIYIHPSAKGAVSMRFDKDIWKTNSPEYKTPPAASSVNHFTPAASTFVSLWLSLIQDDRTPKTMALRDLALPDLLAELIDALSSTKDALSKYRVRSASHKLSRKNQILKTEFPGKLELTRLVKLLKNFYEYYDEDDPKKKRDKEKDIRQEYCLKDKVDLASYFAGEIERTALGALAQVSATGEYPLLLADHVRNKLSASTPDALSFYEQSAHDLAELLALSFDAGNSRESLAELPIKNLRGDNDKLTGKSLEDRVALVFGGFKEARQTYVVYLPLVSGNLEVDGSIFPDGVSVLPPDEWKAIYDSQFSGCEHHENLPDDVYALKVELSRFLKSEQGALEEAPRDLFAARDTAVLAAQACLDAIFLYRPHHLRFAPTCAFKASNPKYECILHHKGVFRVSLDVDLEFVRSIPAEWMDAIYWFRTGNRIEKDESGVVNLWTSAELLSARLHGTHGTNIQRVCQSIGKYASIFGFIAEQEYLGRAAIEYAKRYTATIPIAPPTTNKSESILHWWYGLIQSQSETPTDLVKTIFKEFPLLGVKAIFAKRDLEPSKAFETDETFCGMIMNDLAWCYACRNVVVHEGRSSLRGASIARDLLSSYVGTTLKKSLAARSRGNVRTLKEAFALAAEKDITMREHFKANRILEGLLTPNM